VKISVHPYFLEFIHPFALSHGTRTGTQLAYVKIEFEGNTAYGEASLPPYLKETFDSVKTWVQSQSQSVLELLSGNPFEDPEKIPFSSENPAASAALQSAILNYYVSSKGKTLFDYFDQKDAKPDLSLTITKNDIEFLNEKSSLEKNFSHFKLKLTGASDDVDFVKLMRSKSTLPFCIDINQGYQKKEEAIQVISSLEKLDCILIEQPLNKNDHEGHYWLKQRTILPIIADESIGLYDDLLQYHEAYSGANIKLMKCGGLFQAQKMIHFTPLREEKFMKFIGCMSESSLGVSTAAVLASQCQMADLDAPYLNTNDPFEGFQILDKKIEIAHPIKLKNKALFK
jgi:L-alanine-DL-glutamate epimerase-like enolase superfamily enzyme